MPEWLSRTELLLGKERLEKLQQAHVLVAGLGGVGAYAAEQLCRAGIGEMTIIDGDVVELTNKNRQFPALDCNHSLQLGWPVVSSMGSGGKLDPSKIAVADISKSYNCNLARMLRKRLHKLGVYKGVKVVFSSEFTDPEAIVLAESRNKKSNVGTISYMPPIFGCFIASVVVRDLIGE